MIITLPYPPSVNHYWRHQRGIHHISAKGIAYRKEVWAICKQKRIKTLTGALAVVVYANPPDKRRRDLDNLFKSLLDALTHAGVWEDDSQIDDLRIVRRGILKGGAITLSVEAICGDRVME